jgi:hypothetical protein
MNLAVRDDERALTGYQVWRLPQGQEQNETVWTPLTPAAITTLNYADAAWQAQPAGTYKWAVKAIYTNGVSSLAMFSNALVKLPVVQGQILGLVTNPDTSPIGGAVVTAGGQTCVTSVEYGSYTLFLPSGIYSVTCSATSYDTQTRDDIVVVLGQITELNFVMVSTAAEDDLAVTATALKANFPNPFRSETTLNFDVKEPGAVRIGIYNAKGQLIRTLLNATEASGHHSLVWNGKDEHGNAVGSGIYTYRLQAGKYIQTRRMMVVK